MDICGIVLAGGKGERLSENKELEIIDSRTLIEQVITQICLLDNVTSVVVVSERKYSHIAHCTSLKMRRDIYPGKGPLGGIYTGLKVSESFYNLVVACDMPFLNQDLLQYLVEEAGTGFDLVVPRVGDLIEPLHAVYSKDCLHHIDKMFDEDELSVRGLFTRVRVRYVEAEEIERFDPGHLSFFNVNTRAELLKAREIEKGRKG